jgi:hypothetical protein
MAGYSQLLFTCSQDEDYVGSENFFQPPNQFPTSAFRSYIQNPSSTSRNLVQEFEPYQDNIGVREKEVDEEGDVQIVEPAAEPTKKKKGAIGKKKALTKKRVTKVKVEGEGEGEEEEEEEGEGEKKKKWLDNEVEHLIALRGEMHPEFEKNAKKQGTS